MTVYMNFRVPVRITKRRKWYLASCPLIDIHSQGETQKAAKNNLTEALLVFFVSCLERNTLDAVLKECGFLVEHNVITEPMRAAKGRAVKREDYIDVPIPLVAHSHQQACHA